MSAAYVPESYAELAGYLGSLVEDAAKNHPDDKDLARGVAVYEAWKAAQDRPANPDRRCRNCGATSGLKMLHRNPLTLAAREWECRDGCAGGAS